MEKTTSCHLSFFVGILFLVRSRRSSLRLQTNEKPSAKQSNKICSVSNDRLGIKAKMPGIEMEDEGGRSSKDRGRKQKSIFSFEKMLIVTPTGFKPVTF